MHRTGLGVQSCRYEIGKVKGAPVLGLRLQSLRTAVMHCVQNVGRCGACERVWLTTSVAKSLSGSVRYRTSLQTDEYRYHCTRRRVT